MLMPTLRRGQMMRLSSKGFTPAPIGNSATARAQLVRAFTLIELIFTFAILATCILGILLTYISMFILLDLSRDITLANNAVQARMEVLKDADFIDLTAGTTSFNLADYGFISPNSAVQIIEDGYLGYTSPAQLKRVRIVACFRSRGRVIGEDTNLNGILDAGEDVNGNGRMDSTVELITLITQ